ncbi:hypothetical protein BaRGS_00008885 [Batillaria attramentaria]|uniref:Uncharacterized protein n=1 Tax=Batillaria attramentaria TaxID=370345 RepID=A0ABD0LLD5_9CAEN
MSVNTRRISEDEQLLPPASYKRNSQTPIDEDSVGSFCCTILCLLATLALSIAMLYMGAKYLHDCPAQPNIPIYLVVFGVFGTLGNFIAILRQCRCREDDEDCILKCVVWLINVFLVAWFIAGSVWIYTTSYDSTDPSKDNYCDPTLHTFAYWVITPVNIVLGVLLGCYCIYINCLSK